MKTQLNKFALLAALVCLTLGCIGCQSTAKLADKAAEFERLGITEAEITGKFSHTDYKVERSDDGRRKAVLEHSNAWLPKVRIVRETQQD